MDNENKIQKGFDLSCNYISYQNRTEYEIIEYLKKKKYNDEIINQIVEKLKEYNYINDANYVRTTLKVNYASKKYGKKRLTAHLQKKGIPIKYIRWIENQYPDHIEKQCAAYHFEKASQKYDQEPFLKKKNKITAYMIRKGFAYTSYIDLLNQIKNYDENENVRVKDDIEKYFQKYLKMQMNKGYTESELKRRVTNNLISRGYSTDEIRACFKNYNENDL